MDICKECLNSSKLCKSCKDLLKQGKITKEYVDVARVINKLSKTNKELKNVEFKNVVDAGRILVVADHKNAKKLIGPQSSVVRSIADELKKPVRIVMEPRREKDFLKHVLGNVPIVGVNVLYGEKGEVYRVAVNNYFRKKINISPEQFSQVMKQLTGKDMELVFE